MALSATTLRDLIIAELEARGFETSNEHARTVQFAEAIAMAVVTHITAAGKANVTGGSSAGQWALI